MRISDWSSDVCSSDLLRRPFHLPHGHIIPISGLPCPAGGRSITLLLVVLASEEARNVDPVVLGAFLGIGGRSPTREPRHAFEQAAAAGRASGRFGRRRVRSACPAIVATRRFGCVKDALAGGIVRGTVDLHYKTDRLVPPTRAAEAA